MLFIKVDDNLIIHIVHSKASIKNKFNIKDDKGNT